MSSVNNKIILIHKGYSEYLSLCIKMLKIHQRYEVVLLGDDSNKIIADRWGASHVMADQHLDENWEKKGMGFIHNSYLPSQFEKFCFTRFGILLNYAENAGLKKLIYMDSDIISLNRFLLENFQDALRDYSVVSLSEESTFFSAWSIQALRKYVESFPEYFSGDPHGDRHCDMFAFKRFVKKLPVNDRRTDLITEVPLYDPKLYGNDPNYSFAPIVMKWSGIWGYQKLRENLPSIKGLINYDNNNYYINYPDLNMKVRADFIHLNGFTKFYIKDIEDFIDHVRCNDKSHKK